MFLSALQYVCGLVFKVVPQFMHHHLDVLMCSAQFFVRGSAGCWMMRDQEKGNLPKKAIILYDLHCCPFCKKVREVISALALDVIIYPCPKVTLDEQGVAGEAIYRKKLKEIGGKCQFPYLIDPNTDKQMYESDEIIKYLLNSYGHGTSMTWGHWFASMLGLPGLFLSIALRPLDRMGMKRSDLALGSAQEKMIELWGYENSPFCAVVLEALGSLEIAYKLITVPHNCEFKRDEFRKRFGDRISDIRKGFSMIQVPLLLDPNNGVEMFESKDIVAYLHKTYSKKAM